MPIYDATMTFTLTITLTSGTIKKDVIINTYP